MSVLNKRDNAAQPDRSRARGLLTNAQSGARVDATQWPPPAALMSLVACFWTSRWALAEAHPHHVEMLADPCMHVVFEARTSRLVGVSTKRFVRTLRGRGRFAR